MTVGYALLGVQPLFVKLATTYGQSSAMAVCWRFVVALLLLALVAPFSGQSLRTQQPVAWVLRGILGGSAVLFYFESVRLVGAGLGTLLNYTYPIWANLLSFTIGERPSRTAWIALPLALLGATLVVRPHAGPVGLGGWMGLGSAVLAGGAIVCIRKLRQTDGELSIIASFSSFGLLFAVPVALWEGSLSSVERALGDGLGWSAAAMAGLLSFFGHVYFTRGYKDTSIQLGTVLSLLVPVMSAFGGWLFLEEVLAPSFLLGGSLILVAIAILAYRESQTS